MGWVAPRDISAAPGAVSGCPVWDGGARAIPSATWVRCARTSPVPRMFPVPHGCPVPGLSPVPCGCLAPARPQIHMLHAAPGTSPVSQGAPPVTVSPPPVTLCVPLRRSRAPSGRPGRISRSVTATRTRSGRCCASSAASRPPTTPRSTSWPPRCSRSTATPLAPVSGGTHGCWGGGKGEHLWGVCGAAVGMGLRQGVLFGVGEHPWVWGAPTGSTSGVGEHL